ncbi:MAG: replication initiation protein [Candidatus Phytoplasma sp.]|nr:replication initiation protein [Phytoplasma sp.]
MIEKDNFICMIPGDLSIDDHKVLMLLYQPIMGFSSYSIYSALFHLVNKKNYKSEKHKHLFLFDLLNIKEENFIEAREKLEALNLLETYQKNKNYIYMLKHPLSAQQFLRDTIFGQFLLSQVGETTYLALTKQFLIEKENLDEYENISKQFDDLFEFKTLKMKDNSSYIGKRNNGGVIFDSEFDYELFISNLPERLKKPILLNFKTVDHVKRLSFVYQLNEKQLAEIYIHTALPNGQINIQELSVKTKQYYETLNKNTKPVITEKTNDNDLELEVLKKSSPQRIITKLCKNNYQAVASDTVATLLERNQVEIGIINVLLLHVLKIKEGILPGIKYLEKVLENWQQRGITTTEDAYKFYMEIEKYEPSKKGRQKNKGVAKEVTPEWLDSYMEGLEEWK